MRSEKYDTEADAEQIKSELNAQGYTLVEVWNVEAGNFLFFQEPGWTAPPAPEEPQIQRLQKKIDMLTAQTSALADTQEMHEGAITEIALHVYE